MSAESASRCDSWGPGRFISHGISEHTLYRWKKKYGTTAS
jgi:hypothetical protein